MNSILEQTVTYMFTNGGFSFTDGKDKIDILVGSGFKKNQIIIRHFNGTSYEEKTVDIKSSQCIDELLNIVEYSLFNRINGRLIKDRPYLVMPIQAGDNKRNIEAACTLVNIYSSILFVDRLAIKEVLLGEDFSKMCKLIYREYQPREYESLNILLEEIREKYSYYLRICREITDKEDALVTLRDEKGNREGKIIQNRIVTNNEPRTVLSNLNILKSITHNFEFIDDKTFLVNPAVGREKEIRRLGATMMSPSFSSILIGEPGVGKTAVVEGLAYEIQNSNVGNYLNSKKILKISPSSLVAGCRYRGDFEKKMELLVKFLRENSSIILYMDELHTALGAGSAEGTSIDLLDILKPYIEDGSVKIIGATTIREYDTYLQKDPAFTRRFDCMTIKELDDKYLREVLISNIEKYEIKTGLVFENDEDMKHHLISVLLDITSKNHRSYYEYRYNPALSLSIIEMAFGLAGYDNSEVVGAKYLSEAIEICDCISDVAKTMGVSSINSYTQSEKKMGKIIEFSGYNN